MTDKITIERIIGNFFLTGGNVYMTAKRVNCDVEYVDHVIDDLIGSGIFDYANKKRRGIDNLRKKAVEIRHTYFAMVCLEAKDQALAMGRLKLENEGTFDGRIRHLRFGFKRKVMKALGMKSPKELKEIRSQAKYESNILFIKTLIKNYGHLADTGLELGMSSTGKYRAAAFERYRGFRTSKLGVFIKALRDFARANQIHSKQFRGQAYVTYGFLRAGYSANEIMKIIDVNKTTFGGRIKTAVCVLEHLTEDEFDNLVKRNRYINSNHYKKDKEIFETRVTKGRKDAEQLYPGMNVHVSINRYLAVHPELRQKFERKKRSYYIWTDEKVVETKKQDISNGVRSKRYVLQRLKQLKDRNLEEMNRLGLDFKGRKYCTMENE